MTSFKNSHFKNVDRAPYEIGHLLQSLPPDFAHYKEQPAEVHGVAEAIERHAYNAKGTILSGLEAIGSVMFAAGTNENCGVDKQSIADIGLLLRHLAVELQYLIEIEEECVGLEAKRKELAVKKGGK